MEGKLIKRDNDFYSLIVDGLVMATSNGMIVDYKLSLKNCQSIANGYDLDELALEGVKNFIEDHIDRPIARMNFKKGFQKALELLGDKKFSEYDIRKAYNTNHYSAEDKEENWSTFFKQLQPKEWDVEIVMIYGFDDINDPKPFSIPKLDSDGFLILKRK